MAMEIKICYMNDDRNRRSCRNVLLEMAVEEIRSGKYAKETRRLRKIVGNEAYSVVGDDSTEGTEVVCFRGLPTVCFALEMANRNGVRLTKAYNGLVLLEINNLPDFETVKELREAVASIPFTMLAFVGAEQRSVKIVCRVQAASRALADVLKAAVKERGENLRLFHATAYHQLRRKYSSYLQTNVDLVEPRLDVGCLMSADANVYYNAGATPFVVDDGMYDEQATDEARSEGAYSLGLTYHGACLMRYINIQAEAYAACGEMEGEKWAEAVLHQLAKMCRDADLPMEFCLMQVRLNMDLSGYLDVAEQLFNAYYVRKVVKTEEGRNRLLGTSDLIAMKTERFLLEHYQFRVNMMTGVTQYRRRNALQVVFKDVTPRAMNTMCLQAVDAGLGIWDKDIRRYLDSDRIPEFDPVNDYLDRLPQWDGKDRLTPFLSRVKTDNPCWLEDGKVWMRSMVAHWMGKDAVHGNAIVPVLIGRQGGGKTSFCSIVLPPELRDYYNDNISFKSDTDLNMGLTRFCLINIDEFDALSPTKHPLLKYLLSKGDVKMRPPYGKAYVQRRRMASFIATTNNLRPLTDATGSRRFVCIKADEIDHTSAVNYPQLYAQLKADIQAGKPYYFRDADNQRIMQQNEAFMRVMNFPTMVTTLFLPANQCKNVGLMSIQEIVSLLAKHFPTFTGSNNAEMRLGRVFVDMGYERVRRTKGTCYRIALREAYQN